MPIIRNKAHISKEIEFKTKPQIALDQIRAAHAAGVVLADAGYGVKGGFRAGATALDLHYVVGVQSTLTVWPPGQEPLPAKPWSGHGRKPSRLNRDLEHQPVTVKELALSLKKKAWRTLTWREGSNTPLTSCFAAVRLRPASRDYNRTKPHPVEWLIVEWPNGGAEPTTCWLSTLPVDTHLQHLVDKAKFAVFTTTQHSAWQFTGSLSANGKRFPLSLLAAQDASATQRFPTRGRRRSDPNVTSKTRSRRSENSSSSRSQKPLRDVHAAKQCTARQLSISVLDTVELAGISILSDSLSSSIGYDVRAKICHVWLLFAQRRPIIQSFTFGGGR